MALMTCENVIKEIEPRRVTVKGVEKLIYDAVDKDEVKWTIWEKPLAEQAWALKGVVSLMKVAIDQNGSYTNRTLKEIQAKPTGGFEPALGAMEASLGNIGTLDLNTGTSSGLPTEAKALVEEPSYKDRNIWRQTAAKVSAALSQTQTEFWSNVDDLVRYFETGVKPGQQTQPVFGTPAYVAQGDTFDQMEHPPVQTDDEIPF